MRLHIRLENSKNGVKPDQKGFFCVFLVSSKITKYLNFRVVMIYFNSFVERVDDHPYGFLCSLITSTKGLLVVIKTYLKRKIHNYEQV